MNIVSSVYHEDHETKKGRGRALLLAGLLAAAFSISPKQKRQKREKKEIKRLGKLKLYQKRGLLDTTTIHLAAHSGLAWTGLELEASSFA
jgi:hypothetical protein